MSKIIVIFGMLVSLFFTFPFFINFMKTFAKIFAQVKELVSELTINSIVKAGVSKPLKETVKERVFGPGGFLSSFMANASSEAATKTAASSDTPGQTLVRGLGKIAEGIGDTLVDRLHKTKLLLAEILENKLLFAFFVFGTILFIIGLKMAYDFIMIGWTKMSLDFYDKKSTSIRSLFVRPSTWIKYVLATVLFLIISSIPTVIYFWFYLLINYFVKIPHAITSIGYIIAMIFSWCLVLRLWFYPYYIVDEDAGIIDSLKRSYNMGLGFLNVVISLLVFLFIAGIPLAIALKWPDIITFTILGIILAIVWMASWMSYAYLYSKLKINS